MEKITKENVERLQNELKEKQKKMLDEANEKTTGKVFYPPYFEKRKQRLSPKIKELLQESAKNKYEAVDDYGAYRTGTFLYRASVVTVSREDGLWSLHIISEHPVTLPDIKEIRYKFLPDDVMMAMLFSPREVSRATKGVILYQIPNGATEEE